jgi:hypothetical protein
MEVRRKVESIRPVRFGFFPGFSYIFDNPAAARHSGTPMRLMQADVNDTSQRLYAVLAEFAAKSAVEHGLLERFHFCLLPSSTYHVTACDLVNAANIGSIAKSPFTERVERLWESMRGLGSSTPDRFLTRLAADEMASAIPDIRLPPERGTSFEFKEFAIVGNEEPALLAVLQPADGHTSTYFEALLEERAIIQRQLGLPPAKRWEAHVSIGYFPERAAAEDVAGLLPEFHKRLTGAAPPLIKFTSIGLYLFRDMTTFWRIR